MATRQLATGMILLAGMAVAMIAGCGSDWQNCNEKFISAGITGGASAPPWVQGKVPNDAAEQEVYFVGRGIGYNVFDERTAYNNALDDAKQQLAQYIATWVSEREKESDCRMWRGGEKPFAANVGPRFLPGEKAKDTLGSCAKMTTEALAGELAARDVYWERWQLAEEPADHTPFSNTPSRTMNRYKCWILVSIDKTKLETRIAATMAALKAGSSYKVYRVEGTETTERFATGGASSLYRLSSRK